MSNTERDIAALRDDFSALQRDVADLIAHLKDDAKVGTSKVADQIGAGAQRLLDSVTGEGECATKYACQQIEKQPLLALLIAAGIGYVGGRILSR